MARFPRRSSPNLSRTTCATRRFSRSPIATATACWTSACRSSAASMSPEFDPIAVYLHLLIAPSQDSISPVGS